MADGWLRVALADGSALRPIVEELGSGRRQGYRLFVVDQLATRRGVEDYRGGKRVWFELMPQKVPWTNEPCRKAGDRLTAHCASWGVWLVSACLLGSVVRDHGAVRRAPVR